MRTRVLVIPIFSVALALAAAPRARAGVQEGDLFVEIDGAKTADGKTFKLQAMAGKWVLYTFGAKWCQPCHKELPAWDKLAPKFAGKVLFVAVNINNDPAEGKAFVQSLGLKHMFPVYLPADKSEAMKKYDPDHMPSTFVIDPEGTVRLVKYTYEAGDEQKLAAELDKLIGD